MIFKQYLINNNIIMGTGGNDPSAVENKTENNGGEGDDCFCVCCKIFCFHSNTMIKLLEKDKIINKRISDIHKGDQVLTYDGKNKIISKVTKNLKNKGLFEFFTIKCKDENLNIKTITITGNHTMIIYQKIKHELAFRYANQVKIGDLFITPDGLFEVYEIKKEMMNNSYEMRVEDGTVLANDILVSTLYLENNEILKNQKKIIYSFKNECEKVNMN
jgi:hypothetical protein